MVLTWVPPVIVRICEWTLAVVVVLFLAVPTANAQCETTGQCFCDAGTMERGPGVSIDQLIRGVRIALGEAECPGASLTPTPTDAATGTPTATATTGPAVLQ